MENYVNVDNNLNVFAGRPGAGKTVWAKEEILNLLKEENNVVVYIGHPEQANKIRAAADGLSGKLYCADENHFGAAIGLSVDMANIEEAGETGDSEEAQDNRMKVFIFYDQCRYQMAPGYRHLLLAAVHAGVVVNVFCQRFSQVSRGDNEWLFNNCDCYVIAKCRSPRMATKEEIDKTYQ